jgi:hypothetical protein
LNGTSFISSVDSGNLVASLYTLHAGALDLIERPLCCTQIFTGIRTHWNLMQSQGKLPSKLASFSMPGSSAPLADWTAWLQTAEEALAAATTSLKNQLKSTWWYSETVHRIGVARSLIRNYTPWLLPEFEMLRKLPELGLSRAATLSIAESIAFAESLDSRLANAQNTLVREPSLIPLDRRIARRVAHCREKLAHPGQRLASRCPGSRTSRGRNRIRFPRRSQSPDSLYWLRHDNPENPRGVLRHARL